MSKMRQGIVTAWIAFFIAGLQSFSWAQGQPITFSAFGDIPYSSSEYTVLQQYVADHNRYSPSVFITHVGDILSGSTCPENKYSDVANIMKGFAVPAYIVVGDNEYNDCADPVQGFAYWKKYFTNFEQNFCGNPYTEHQSVRPENWAFVLNGVLFIGINLVGSDPFDQNEWDTRLQDDANWVSQQYQAKGSQVRAAAVFSQAWTGSNRTLFFDQFRPASAAFGKPVLFIHGDLHTFRFDLEPFSDAQNVIRLGVPKGQDEPPLQVTVTMDSNPQSAFTVLRNPWSGAQPYNMPPCADAGPDQTIMLATAANLQGEATDDGDPSGSLTTTWSVASGPGTVTFGDSSLLATTATFDVEGIYVLRLTADDGALQKNDDVTIVVEADSTSQNGVPVISSFTPTSGAAGTVVTIVGSNFTGIMVVAFNGTAAVSFTVDSSSQISATVPAGATTGKIIVTNSAGTDSSAADFTVTLPPAQYTLTVDTVGSGNVSLDPAGGNYDEGTEVTLTATAASGWQFSGWSGDLTGSNNPATITMNADKNVTATFTTSGTGGQVVHEETRTGVSSDSITVTTSTNLTGATGDLYLAAISTRRKVGVQGVTGLGLTWTLVKTKCAGRNSTGISVWKAQGTPSGDGMVTATFTTAPTTAVIAVSRYSGVASVNSVGKVIAGNSNGLNTSAVCTGGVDNNAYSFNFSIAGTNNVVYCAAAMKSRGHTPGTGFTERREVRQQATNFTSSVAVQDKEVPLADTVTVDGSFNGTVDWALVALVIKPATGMAKSSSTAENAALAPPAEFQLEQNYPNPFNPSTVISFALPAASQVTLQIFNETGQLIRTLVAGEREIGRYAVRWNGRNQSGNTIAAGMYLYRIVARDVDGNAVFMQTRQMTFLK